MLDILVATEYIPSSLNPNRCSTKNLSCQFNIYPEMRIRKLILENFENFRLF